MRIWIDLANSPHVLIFQPIIRRLTQSGHQVSITIRDFAQTLGLSQHFNLAVEVINANAVANPLSKMLNISYRAFKLRCWGKRNGPFELAISHNSYAHCLAARSLGIVTVTLMDYEHTVANHIAFRAANRVIVPEVFPDRALRKFGAHRGKVRKYPGIKEEIYLLNDPQIYSDNKERKRIEQIVGRPLDEVVIVTVRPPATMAIYHQFENKYFGGLIDFLCSKENLVIIMLSRTPMEQSIINTRGYYNMRFPDKELDGRVLIRHSDLVISAGGTMNREAAVLGTPAYTIFAGKIGAVDRLLIEQGRLVDLIGPLNSGAVPKQVFSSIKLVKKLKLGVPINNGTINKVIKLILKSAILPA